MLSTKSDGQFGRPEFIITEETFSSYLGMFCGPLKEVSRLVETICGVIDEEVGCGDDWRLEVESKLKVAAAGSPQPFLVLVMLLINE